jgi:tRNA(fMet)-specific endonuclease VapC
MSFRAMLDTNIVSHALRYPHGSAADQMTMAGQLPICVSVVVAAELHFGARKKGSEKLSRQVTGILRTFSVLPFDEAAAAHYAELRATLERAGTPIGANDLFIAAHALAMELTLVTGNVGEFSRVPGLRLENWLD